MNMNKESKPIILTVLLLIATFFVVFANWLFPQNSIFPNRSGDLTITLWLLSVIDIGFIVALILGIRTKKPSIIWFSIISNGMFFILLSAVMLLLAIANGISEP
ncbi:hypothetical protein SFC65_24390 [Priestia filamentosa]|uniref:hypothetical protein n=1 Tax=Priestia filamentosa TaxID=1402861 RepID=UPI0039823F5F